MDTGLIVRLVISVIAAINMLAGVFGFTPLNIDDDTVYTVVSAIAMVGTWAWGFWKNNNFTKAAKEGQLVTDAIKAGCITIEDDE